MTEQSNLVWLALGIGNVNVKNYKSQTINIIDDHNFTETLTVKQMGELVYF